MKLRKVYDLTGLSYKGQGGFGSYYQLSKTFGIKVLQHAGASSLRELRSEDHWHYAKHEADFLRRVRNKIRNVPRCYGRVVVRQDDCYYAGIAMQHIEGKELSRCGLRKIEKTQRRYLKDIKNVMNLMYNYLLSHGIYHDDLHDDNILVTIKKDKVIRLTCIDFDPEFSHLVSKREAKRLLLEGGSCMMSRSSDSYLLDLAPLKKVV